MSKELSRQAKNTVDLCKGNDSEVIQRMLRVHAQDIKDELMSYYKCDSYEELAIRLSVGG